MSVHVFGGKSHSPMPRTAINFDTVRKIGLALPGVEESTVRVTRAQGSQKAFGVRACSSVG